MTNIKTFCNLCVERNTYSVFEFIVIKSIQSDEIERQPQLFSAQGTTKPHPITINQAWFFIAS
jgi:hypothetical protein